MIRRDRTHRVFGHTVNLSCSHGNAIIDDMPGNSWLDAMGRVNRQYYTLFWELSCGTDT